MNLRTAENLPQCDRKSKSSFFMYNQDSASFQAMLIENAN